MTDIPSDESIAKRWLIEDFGSKVVITIPQKFSWFGTVFSVVILAFIYFLFISDKKIGVELKYVFAVILLLNLKGWLWNLGGVEVITFENQEVSIRYEFLGLSRSRKTPFAQVRGFVFEPRLGGRGGHPARVALVRQNDSAWSLFSRIRFADDVSEQEASELIGVIHERFPEFFDLGRETRTFGLNR